MNIVLVDDHAVVRQGYASLLRAVLPTMEVREAASGEEALARVQEQVPNLVIMDFGLPGISGLETTRRLRQRLPQLRVLFFSMHDELPLVRQALELGLDVDGGQHPVRTHSAEQAQPRDPGAGADLRHGLRRHGGREHLQSGARG